MCCLQEIHFKTKDTYRPQIKKWKNIIHASENDKKPSVVILKLKKKNRRRITSLAKFNEEHLF